MSTDFALAFRTLRKSPGFALTAVVLIALGIGANSAMFSIMDAWLLRPLNFPEPERLVSIWRTEVTNPFVPASSNFFFDYEGWRDGSHSFSSMAASFPRPYTVTGDERPEELRGSIATVELFSTLKVGAALGRTFTASDLQGPPVAVISNGLWVRRYASAPDTVGRLIKLSGKTYKIIGVLPPDFSFRTLQQPAEKEVFTLLQPAEDGYRANPFLPVLIVARLKPGFTNQQAQADVAVLQRQIDRERDVTQNRYTVMVANLQDDYTRTIRSSVVVLAATSGFVLLIACANLAGLLLGRASERRKELAIRAALGSTRLRLMGPLASEGCLIAVGGAGLGILFAIAATRAFVAFNPLGMLPPSPISVSPRVLAFTGLLALMTAVGVGLAPALAASRVDLNEVLKEGGRGGSAAGRTQRMRRLMVVAEVALSIILLTGAGLMIETFLRLASEPMGFRVDNLSLMRLLLPKSKYGGSERRDEIYDRLLSAIRAIPGVESVAISTIPPLTDRMTNVFAIEGQPALSDELLPKATEELVTPDFFSAMGIPLISGRTFWAGDRQNTESVAVINQETAHRYFDGVDPIGKRVKPGGTTSKSPWLRIIGIVGATKFKTYNTNVWTVYPEIFMPNRQLSGAAGTRFEATSHWVVVRTKGPTDPKTLNAALRRQIWSVDSEIPVKDVRSMDEVIAQLIVQPRLRAVLLGLFGGIALLLAAVGVYGVMSQLVTQRTHEIAIRVAMGAGVPDVVRMVLQGGLALTAIGIAIGVAGALALTRVLQGLLFGVKPTSVLTFTGVSLLMLLVASIATLMPARRAARIHPVTALREAG